MFIRISIKGGTIKKVELAPHTEDEVQILDYDSKSVGESWVDFISPDILKEIDPGNPPKEI